MRLLGIQSKLLEDCDEKMSFRSIVSIPEKLGYSKQTNQKMLKARELYPDMNQQFELINNKAARFLRQGLPVISVDTRKRISATLKTTGRNTTNPEIQERYGIMIFLQLISGTKTTKGLKVICKVDYNEYKFNQKVTDKEYAQINLCPGKHWETETTLLSRNCNIN